MMALCRGVMILLLVSQSSRWSSATSSALELIRCVKLRRAFCFVQNGKYSMAKYAVSSMAIDFKILNNYSLSAAAYFPAVAVFSFPVKK